MIDFDDFKTLCKEAIDESSTQIDMLSKIIAKTYDRGYDDASKIVLLNDYVKVTRCKDCINYDGEWCYAWLENFVNDDDFCSRAERKES